MCHMSKFHRSEKSFVSVKFRINIQFISDLLRLTDFYHFVLDNLCLSESSLVGHRMVLLVELCHLGDFEDYHRCKMEPKAFSATACCSQQHSSLLETRCYRFLLVGIACRLSVVFCQNRRNPLTRCFHLHSFFHFSSYQLPKFSKFHQAVDNSFLREFASTFDVLPQIGSKVLAIQMFVENRKFDKHQQFDRH